MHHIIYIKNMVCPRCITAVSVILDKLGIPYKTIKLGEVYLEREPDEPTKKVLVKELIVYDELSLNEIAHQMGYSSVAFLSNQFKKITGRRPTQFKKSVTKNRKSLDKI